MEIFNVYLMATGEIAIPVLDSLQNNSQINLCGTCTQPDKPKGRKKALSPSEIGQAALKYFSAVEIDKVENVNNPEFLSKLAAMNLDFIVVMAFGQLLKQPILDLPKFGCINIHASILPKYRGASPINAAILNGDKETGISIMQMEKGLDSGPVHSIYKVEIIQNETVETLQNKLAQISGEKIIEALISINVGKKFIDQNLLNNGEISHVGKIAKNDGLVNWQKSAEQLERESRGYFPWPTLFLFGNFGGKERKITIVKAKVVEQKNGVPGDFLQFDKNGWLVACGKGALQIERIIPEGSNEMNFLDFFRGLKI